MKNGKKGFIDVPKSLSRSPGRTLPHLIREKMEAAFGADFGSIHIHEDPQACCLGVLAFTRGEEIYFAPGAYDPWSPRGQQILGHELAHVVQQRAGRVPALAGSSMALNTDPLLEAEAEVAGMQAALGRPVTMVRLGPGSRETVPVVQCYTIVPPGRRTDYGITIPDPKWNANAGGRVDGDTFVGQNRRGATFLTEKGRLNKVSLNPTTVTLRLSINRKILIEHTDLIARQPKVFYATQDILDASNKMLLGKSTLLLEKTNPPQVIQVNGETLYRIVPVNRKIGGVSGTEGVSGINTSTEPDCGLVVANIVGTKDVLFPGAPKGEQIQIYIGYFAAWSLLPPEMQKQIPLVESKESKPEMEQAMTMLARYYMQRLYRPDVQAKIKELEINQYTTPAIGEGFVTIGLTSVPHEYDYGGKTDVWANLVENFNTPNRAMQIVARERLWMQHYGGVVASDGTDVVTLENYSRVLEDREVSNSDMDTGDTRYYFQMYNTNGDTDGEDNQSWHRAWTTTTWDTIAPPQPPLQATHQPRVPGLKGFANPITLRIARPK